jgi:hypothetical protein
MLVYRDGARILDQQILISIIGIILNHFKLIRCTNMRTCKSGILIPQLKIEVYSALATGFYFLLFII